MVWCCIVCFRYTIERMPDAFGAPRVWPSILCVPLHKRHLLKSSLSEYLLVQSSTFSTKIAGKHETCFVAVVNLQLERREIVAANNTIHYLNRETVCAMLNQTVLIAITRMLKCTLLRLITAHIYWWFGFMSIKLEVMCKDVLRHGIITCSHGLS